MTRIFSDKRFAFAGFGAVGGLLSGLVYHLVVPDSPEGSWILGTGFDGLFIATLLGLAQGRYVGKTFDKRGMAKTALIGGIGGMIGGLVALYVGFPLAGMLGAGTDVGRFIGWAAGGLAVGYAVSRVVPNLEVSKASAAGAAGGFVGCGLMYLAGSLAIGLAVIGAAIGLAIAYAEIAFRQVWLEVTIRPGRMSLSKERTLTVTLGEAPVVFGCGVDADVQLEEMAGAKANFARVSLSGGRVTFHDLTTEKSRTLSVNDAFEVSNARVVLRSKSE